MTAFSVTSAVDRYVESLEPPREPDGTWHPSAIFGCLRQASYAARGEPESDPRDARSKRVLRVGHMFHEFIQQAISAYPGVVAFIELHIAIPPLKITGSVDVLVEFDGGRYELIEIKTISSKAFGYADLPKADHVQQLSAYLMALREVGATKPVLIAPLRSQLQRARIVYVSKDDLRIEEFTVVHSEAREVELADRVAVLESHRAADTLPDRLPLTVDARGKSKRDWRCGYCVYATTCWEGVA